MFIQIAPHCIITPIARIVNLVTFFYGSSVIMSEDGTQQGDPEAPALLAEKFRHLSKSWNRKLTSGF